MSLSNYLKSDEQLSSMMISVQFSEIMRSDPRFDNCMQDLIHSKEIAYKSHVAKLIANQESKLIATTSQPRVPQMSFKSEILVESINRRRTDNKKSLGSRSHHTFLQHSLSTEKA